MSCSFTLEATDGGARAGTMRLTHGEVPTPIFMPVGTAGTVKAMTPEALRGVGARIVLGNTYHLYLRPGLDVIRAHGGLHGLMGWERPILTDSGGYQVFSLEGLRTIREEGVEFRSHIDGSPHLFTPERVVQIQETLGSDIAMAFDECPVSTADRATIQTSIERTTRWERRCAEARSRADQAMFGIVQGGLFEDLRAEHARAITALPFEGFAIGGLSVGETFEEMVRLTRFTAPLLPADKPRYLMGVGKPEDILHAIAAGVDMFDCVLPTRNARNGMLLSFEGDLVIKNAAYREDVRPVSASCACYTCAHFTRAYLRHLFMAKEVLFTVLNTIHNLAFYLDLVGQARAAIFEGRYAAWMQGVLERRGTGAGGDALENG
ncbi:MAG: queuine tRNA-ribosyltransferase [Myxococcales bacterium]